MKATFVKILLRVLFFVLFLALISDGVLGNLFHSQAVYPVLLAFVLTWLIDPLTSLITGAVITT